MSLREEDEDLKEMLNQALATIRANDKAEEIDDKYFSLTPIASEGERRPASRAALDQESSKLQIGFRS